MKILHVVASYKPAYVYGGPVMSVAKLCEEVSKVESQQPIDNEQWTMDSGSQQSKVSVTVYTTLANGKEELPYKNGEIKIVDGIEVHYFKRITKDHSHLSPALLWHLWKTVNQFDVVHIHAWWNLVTMPACLIAILRGVKVILTPRGTLSSYSFEVNNSRLKRIFHRYVGRPLLNKTYFHCTSVKEVADTQALLKPKAIHNLPNFVVLPWQNQFKKTNTPANESLKLIFLSRIEQKKGLELLFEVLASTGFEWKLSIVGNGEQEYVESLKQKVKSLQLGQRVEWLGAVYELEKFNLMAANDYLVLPSYDENFANVVIESIFVGTPVLITKNVGLSDYIIDKQLGLVCERSAEGLKHILLLANEAKAAVRFKPEVLTATIAADFKEELLRDSYMRMYKEVLDDLS